MASTAKRKRTAAKGLAVGERLKRDKLAKDEAEHSQWFAACGFLDKFGKPICRNKYTGMPKHPRKKRKIEEPKSDQSNAMSVEEQDIIVISSDDEDADACSKKQCKDNPQCLNYLGQARLEKEEALKDYLETAGLGINPFDDSRDPSLPVGLKNLGATCYANAFIQVWFQDHAFREGVYRCIPSKDDYEDVEESPIFQLQVTFAALQEGIRNVFNPVKLVESLQLRTAEQQDAQEFSKLFMSHLASEFEKQSVPSLKTLIADQFEGNLTYGTLCKRCQNRSERDSDFLELEISIEGTGKLEDRIQALLQSEELTGDNKYYCTHCDNLQDAERYTKLRKLPPVLHFSVLRFVFDLATLSRKKSKQMIMFPPVLDMSPFMDCAIAVDKPLELVYELRGILLHKGPSAYHGHYEAQVYDVTTKQFYQFNDETVTMIKSLQGKKKTADEKDANGTNGTQNRKPTTRKKRRVDDSDTESAPTNAKIDDYFNYISSKDAYMLIYARRDTSTNPTDSPRVPTPPESARERVASLNKKHEEACAAFIEKQKKLTEEFRVMLQRKREIYHCWTIDDLKEDSAVASRSALEHWLSNGLDKPIEKLEASQAQSDSNGHVEPSLRPSPSDVIGQPKDPAHKSASPDSLTTLSSKLIHRGDPKDLSNLSIACQHGALDPRKTSEMKRIKTTALTAIREMGYAVQPAFTTDDICSICIEEIFLERRYALDHASHVKRFEELVDAGDDSEGVWISKAWLRDWRQPIPKMHSHGQPDPDPEAPDYIAHVKCLHGKLFILFCTPPVDQWSVKQACASIQSLFPTWHPTVIHPDERPTCPECEHVQSVTKEERQEVKQQVAREKERLKGLLNSYIESMEYRPTPGMLYALIGADYLRQWRAWISRPFDRSRPGPVDNTWMICEHKGLVVDPDAPRDLGSAVVLISFEDWHSFREFYTGGPVISWSSQHQSEDGEDIVVQNQYDVCVKCRHERLLNFESTTITVHLLDDAATANGPANDEEINTLDQPDTKDSTLLATRGGRPIRSSNRLRQSKRRLKMRTIKITKELTVKDIKVELQEEFNIATICQRLFFKGNEIMDNSETVASLGIMANDTLELKEEKEATDCDVEVDRARKPRDEGRAFGGTVLGGASRKPLVNGRQKTVSEEPVVQEKHCPVCTYINTSDAVVCEMCDSNLES